MKALRKPRAVLQGACGAAAGTAKPGLRQSLKLPYAICHPACRITAAGLAAFAEHLPNTWPFLPDRIETYFNDDCFF